MTGFGEDIQSQFAAADASFDDARKAGSKNIRNISAEIRALREEGLPLAVRIASIESRLAVLSTAASIGAGTAQAAQEEFDNTAQGNQLPAWPSPGELLWPADPLGANRNIP